MVPVYSFLRDAPQGLLIDALLTVLYILLFCLLLPTLGRRSVLRQILGLSIAVVFLFTAVSFGLHIIGRDLPDDILIFRELVFLILPGLLSLYVCHHAWGGGKNSVASLERFNQLKDEFLSVASHELRTPLSVISGFAEILVREKLGPLNDEQKRRVRKILMQGQRLNRIVDELLDLSRIRSGKVQVRNDIFDLVPVLKACLDDHQIICDQQKISLEDRIDDVLPDVRGDIERVTQVIVNLLNNAIKYTESGGRVTLAAYYQKNARQVVIEVSDTGIGIDPKDQPRVFDEFYRCNHQYARKFSGSGLGLAIVKQLVEAQGGKVGIRSEGLGKGSLFYFTLCPALADKQPFWQKVIHFQPKSLQGIIAKNP